MYMVAANPWLAQQLMFQNPYSFETSAAQATSMVCFFLGGGGWQTWKGAGVVAQQKAVWLTSFPV